MKLALDVDDVITDIPEFYSILTKALKNDGHYIYIVIDIDEYFREQRIKELESYAIAYDELIITKDKKEFCEKMDIDYAIDDDISYYHSFFSSPINLIDIKG